MPPPRKLTDDEERIRTYLAAMLAAADKGEVDWLPAFLAEHGYTRIDPGLQQRQIVTDCGIPRKTLLEWETAGLKSVARARQKYYPVLDLIRFLADRLASRTNRKLDDIRERLNTTKADLLELEREEKLGNLVDRREAEAQMIQLVIEIRAALMGIPGALAPKLENQSAPVIRTTLKAHLTWLCNDLQTGRVPVPESVVAQVDALLDAVAATVD